MRHDFFAFCLLILTFFTSGCSTDTVNSPAFEPLTSTASDLFNDEVSNLNSYVYDRGQQLGS